MKSFVSDLKLDVFREDRTFGTLDDVIREAREELSVLLILIFWKYQIESKKWNPGRISLKTGKILGVHQKSV